MLTTFVQKNMCAESVPLQPLHMAHTEWIYFIKYVYGDANNRTKPANLYARNVCVEWEVYEDFEDNFFLIF